MLYILGALSMGITYTITRYFGWREATTLTPEYIILLSLIYIFFGALVQQYLDSLKQTPH